MSGNGGFFSRLGYKLKMGLTRFMQGRYGTDKLNSVILWTGLVVCIVSMFVPMGWPNLLLATLSYVFLGIAMFRCFSRNTYKRYQENRRFMFFLERIKDREHRYYTCPKCREKFVKNTC